MELKQAFFILEHGSSEGEGKYLEAVKTIKEKCLPVVRCKDCKHLRVWNRKIYTHFAPKQTSCFCRLSGTQGHSFAATENERRTTMKKFKIYILLALSALLLALLMGCSEADKVNHNMSKQADYFECERRVTVYNARTDNVILECEGYLSISNNDTNELVVTVKTGPDSYKKNYIYLNAYTLYVVEDITGTHTDPYHYQMYFHAELLPNVDIKP